MTAILRSAAVVGALACLAHEANRVYCSSIGDDSQKPWPDAPDYARESAINGVTFTLDNPEATPASQHENWMKEKLADGWKFGEEKDGRKKTHPCLVPYDELPAAQQAKDALFKAVVAAGAAAVTAAIGEVGEAKGNSDDGETIAALEEQVRTLEEDLAAERKNSAAVDRGLRAAHRKGVKQVKARKLGELKDGTDREALIAAMEAGAELEIVFSNGTAELIEFEPVIVSPQAFQRIGRERFNLRDAVLVKGAGKEQRVRGVALLADGKQIAYTAFPNPVSVPVGQQVKFDRMIGF